MIQTTTTATIILLLILSITCGIALASDDSIYSSFKPSDRVKVAQEQGQDFIQLSLLIEPDNEKDSNIQQARIEAAKNFNRFEILQINTSAKKLASLSKDSPISFVLPTPEGKQTLQLIPVNPFKRGIIATELPSMKKIKIPDASHGLHYHGIVDGAENSIAAISIMNNEILGFTDKGDGLGPIVIGKMDNQKDAHIVYYDEDFNMPSMFECGSVHEEDQEDDHDGPVAGFIPKDAKLIDDCVDVEFEIDSDIMNRYGGVFDDARNYVAGMFNQAAAIYSLENINIRISRYLYWSATSVYQSLPDDSFQMLSTYQNQIVSRGNGIQGTIGHLISFKVSGGGIAAGFSGLCNSDVRNSLCFTGLFGSFNTFPTYSRDVKVLTHEMGHLIGSRHTHACVWNGLNTAIDGCGTPEGRCARPGLPSSGTIMSYCDSTGLRPVDFTLGFGDQPGNLIRSRFAEATCLPQCDDDFSASPTPNPNSSPQSGAGPGSDSCSLAKELSIGSQTSGTTVGATYDSTRFCGTSTTGPGIWYYLIGTGNDITVDTCSSLSDFDTKITVFRGPSCSVLFCVGGDDDGCGGSWDTRSSLTFRSFRGLTYYILVHGWGTSIGDFVLSVSEYTPSPIPAPVEGETCPAFLAFLGPLYRPLCSIYAHFV
mmetsp:Transcript_10427/g.15912  ORF Transcript_10427/g.15912 Transcript_10427/m.15912 type:complete len:652 (-) Transcript_10427:97-2052(-)